MSEILESPMRRCCFLPAELVEILLSNLPTEDLIRLRTTCSTWNAICANLCHKRYVHLNMNWPLMTEGMNIFTYFNERTLPWSAFTLGFCLQRREAFLQQFLQVFGQRLKCLEIPYFSLEFMPSQVFPMLPNLESLTIGKIPYCLTKGFTLLGNDILPKLKFLRVSLGTENKMDADILTSLIGPHARNLDLVDISDLNIEDTKHVRRILSLFVNVKCLNLSIEATRENKFREFRNIKLNVKKFCLSVHCTMSPWKRNLLTSFDCLNSLVIEIFVEDPRSRHQFIEFPSLPSLKHLTIDIASWRHLFWELLSLVVYFDCRLFPNVTKLTVYSNHNLFGDMTEYTTRMFQTGLQIRYLEYQTKVSLPKDAIEYDDVNFLSCVKKCPTLRFGDKDD